MLAQSQRLCGAVQDPTGAMIAGASLDLSTAGSRFDTTTDSGGQFCFSALLPGEYELTVQGNGFRNTRRNILVRPGESSRLSISLALEAAPQRVTVAEGSADTGSLNVSQTQVSAGLIHNLPSESVNAALSSILTLATPGVAADSNGVFHPLGEHAETSFSIDGQPISDQQSRIFSNQISVSTIQEMRTLQGAPPAEFGDKTSLIVEATTRSGLNAGRRTARFPLGTVRLGRPPQASPTPPDRTPSVISSRWMESTASVFSTHPNLIPCTRTATRKIYLTGSTGGPASNRVPLESFRGPLLVPGSQHLRSRGRRPGPAPAHDQFQRGFSVSRVLSPSAVLTANTWVRQDRVNYFPSSNLVSDQPATLSQSRRLTSTGLRTDVTYSHGTPNHPWGNSDSGHSAFGGLQYRPHRSRV